jgi:hypothetical protein
MRLRQSLQRGVAIEPAHPTKALAVFWRKRHNITLAQKVRAF